MEPSAISRRQARRDAMIILYQHDITGSDVEELYNNLEGEEGRPPDLYTIEVVNGVLGSAAELDADIDAHSRGWPSHRLAALERSILRMGTFELRRRPDIPAQAIIDEAVTLAKRFCSREAASLVNGLLGKMAQVFRPEEMGDQK